MTEPMPVEVDWENGGIVVNKVTALRKQVGNVSITYATGWQCPVCFLVWSPLFDGPCIHEDSQGGTDVREIYRQG